MINYISLIDLLRNVEDTIPFHWLGVKNHEDIERELHLEYLQDKSK